MEKPICKECEKNGRKYSVAEPMYGTTTLMAVSPGYWDEEGEYYPAYDPNTTRYFYSCSNGHDWEVKS